MAIGEGHGLKSARFAGDEVLEACYNNRRSLRRGDKGPSVEKIQYALILLGFPVPNVGANGIFGGETELAVRSYQEARGLKIDGIVGSETMGNLDEEFHTGPASEHRASFSTEPQMSDVSSPLVPKSPVRSPKMSPVSAPETRAPSVKIPKVPRVERPSLKIPQPPVPPVPEPPILTTQAVPYEQAPTRKRTASSPATSQAVMIDNQGRKFHSAGTWRGNSSFEVEAGNSIHLEINNTDPRELNIVIKTSTGEAKEAVLQPQSTVDLEFSMIGKEHFNWRFYIETDHKESLINWKLYSNWVPGKP
jgi:hypothetical protein